MKKIVPFFVSMIFLISCSTTHLFKVTKLGEEPEKYLQRAIYVLPETNFLVTIEIEKETYIPGPYRLYTQKYLGLEEYIMEPGFSFRITNVSVDEFTEPDPEHYYSINLIQGEFDWDSYLSLSKFGHILDPDASFKSDISQVSSSSAPDPPYFTDRAIEQNLTDVTDTLYKTVIREGAYVRIPILRSQQKVKTIEQKAREAANFIIRIRNNRFDLMSGELELFPEGEALSITVEELGRLEKEYLELFIGKRIKQRFKKSFIVHPENKKTVQKNVIAKFQPSTGLLDPEDNRGRDIEFGLSPMGKVSNIEPYFRRTSENPNSLLYRIPDMAEIKITIQDEILYEGRYSVFQLGEVIDYPVNNK